LLHRARRVITQPGLIPAKLAAPASIAATKALTRLMPELAIEDVQEWRNALLHNGHFLGALNERFATHRSRHVLHSEWREFLYLAVRALKPEVFIETGVFDGLSTAVILQAIRDNDRGQLVSIDLPAVDTIQGATNCMLETMLPTGCQPGWAVPDDLRDRWRLELGDARELLPALLSEFSKIDVFFHDSLHTFDHQMFEYTTAWPHIREGGLLVSHDIFWSPAFHRFSRRHSRAYVRVEGFGAIRK
jgi:predicted O-methyltransferase YrrM